MDSKELMMKKIEDQVRICQKCRLCKTAKNAVPGEGNINSKIVFVGEAPGATEDETGRPFVGRAGKLLETLLAQINYKREDIWIGNIIKHRPPENRDPIPDEIEACQPYLKLQLETIKPLLVVTLGRFAMNYFYPDGKMTRDHGSLLNSQGLSIYPVYHPAAALRNSDFFNGLKTDFLKIPAVLESLEKPLQLRDKTENEDISSPQLSLDL